MMNKEANMWNIDHPQRR